MLCLGQIVGCECGVNELLFGFLFVVFILYVDDQQGVVDGEWCLEAYGFRGGQEVFVDEGYGCQIVYNKGYGQGSVQQSGEVVSIGQQFQVDFIVVLVVVQFVEAVGVVVEASGVRVEQGGQFEVQQQVQSAVRGVFLQEVQVVGQVVVQ